MRENLIALLFGGLGGALPTLVKVASYYSANPGEPAPQVGVYFALGLYFVIGAIVAIAIATSKSNYKELLIAGIIAPAMITNVVAGYTEGATSRQQQEQLTGWTGFRIMEEAHAAEAMEGDVDQAEGRSITLHLLSPDLSTRERAKTAVEVQFHAEESVEVAEFLASEGTQVFNVPDDVTRIVISAGRASTELEIPRVQLIVVEGHLAVTGKRDFLWALGAKRQLSLGMTAHIRDVIAISEDLTDPLLGAWTVERWKQQVWGIRSTRIRHTTKVTGDLIVQEKVAETTYQGVITFYLNNQTRIIENVEISIEGDKVSMIGTVVEGKAKWTDDRLSLRLDGNTLSGRARDDQPASSSVTFAKIVTQGMNQEG